ncbi:MAG: hypothetical protein KJ077_39035 [Anaerolineae bacterium]|nr:hypothetical protein [Anaerolineae bacterium]
MTDNSVLTWLLESDPAIRWQTLRDLVEADKTAVQTERQQVALQGWGLRLLSYQEPSGLWANGLYTPKWTSTTYTMLLLRQLGLPSDHPQALKACRLLLEGGSYGDGGINYFASLKHSETCVTGMVLSILAYFDSEDERLHQVVEHLLDHLMPDGGWNCQSYNGATHSSFHTTISVLEGLAEYEQRRPSARVAESQQRGVEFLLTHRLFRSHRTGVVVDPGMTRFSFPPRWHYDIMRALDYLQACRFPYDERMRDALALIQQKQRPNGTWPLQNRHPGRTFFELEEVGQSSRWNTLRALRTLKWFEGSSWS